MNVSKASNVIGGKTARACDSCLIKRARWFCAADDAFLCQACDTAVHSANQLASRHERVRLESSSFKVREVSSSPPAWHQGFTRKARTRRQPKTQVAAAAAASHIQLPVVPEMNSSEDPFAEENDETQFFCRVPVFDAFVEEFCTEIVKGDLEVDCSDHMVLHDDGGACQDLNLEELLSNCDDEFVEFAADVESLLATGVEEGSKYYCGNKDLAQGIIGCDEDSERNGGVDEFLDGKRVKIEEKDDGDDDDDDLEVQAAVVACNFDPEIDMELNWEFEIGEEVKKVEVDVVNESRDEKRNMLLRLNYEAVIAAWATQGSPWTDGIRPQFNLDDFMVACLGGNCHQWGGIFGGRSSMGGNDAGREARVSRYREKRRTRLFSKKIRYEVRKLNAEKRPRMKGRFVKRTTFSGSSSLPFQLMNK